MGRGGLHGEIWAVSETFESSGMLIGLKTRREGKIAQQVDMKKKSGPGLPESQSKPALGVIPIDVPSVSALIEQ